MTSARLVLSNGTILKGRAIGALGTTVGELVFNTAMVGYQEVLTDPSYAKQLVTLTYPHIGNTGTNLDDEESARVWSAGLIIRKLSETPSSYRNTCSLRDYLIQHEVIAIDEIDTRHLTHILRAQGSLSACLTTELTDEEALERAKSFSGLTDLDLASLVTCKAPYELKATLKGPHIVVYDFGVKASILSALQQFPCKITVVPARTTIETLLALNPDAIVLSNGPGDPHACTFAIDNTKQLLEQDIPILGICLGFQILALAMGAKTYKMKFGHHGSNHPVQGLVSPHKKVYITSQNHGFAVDEISLPEAVQVTYRSLFDDSLQGFKAPNLLGFQGHPEAGPGPSDMKHLFQDFFGMIKNTKE